jgi:phage-related protein
MAIFDWAESDGSDVGVKTAVKGLQFGDGYEQRSPDGINNIMQRWQLRFDDVDNSIANDIVGFLALRAGWQAFDWTPKWSTAPIKVICKEWTRSIARGDLSNIVCTFEQRFEP